MAFQAAKTAWTVQMSPLPFHRMSVSDKKIASLNPK